jgi:hypothetical protein
MDNLLKNIVIACSLLVFTIAIVVPDIAFARHRTNPLQSKINDLDDEKVLNLPVPLLW